VPHRRDEGRPGFRDADEKERRGESQEQRDRRSRVQPGHVHTRVLGERGRHLDDREDSRGRRHGEHQERRASSAIPGIRGEARAGNEDGRGAQRRDEERGRRGAESEQIAAPVNGWGAERAGKELLQRAAEEKRRPRGDHGRYDREHTPPTNRSRAARDGQRGEQGGGEAREGARDRPRPVREDRSRRLFENQRDVRAPHVPRER
jgi:hypothetical protein